MTYRAGIIGAGGVAGLGILGRDETESIGTQRVDSSHAGGYAASDEVELVGIADVDEDALEIFGECWEIPESGRYADHRDLLEESLDVVSVCTPTIYHAEHAIDAARIGDPDVIWCEKPLAASVAGAEQAIEACAETDTHLVVNHNSRFRSRNERVRELIGEGVLGEVHSVHGHFRRELMRNSTHVLDTLVYWLDLEPHHVSGHLVGENEAGDSLSADIDLDDIGGAGTIVAEDSTVLTVDCTAPRAGSTMFYHLRGTKGKLYVNPTDDEVRYWAVEDGTHVERELPGIADVELEYVGYEDSFRHAVDHAVDLIEGHAENRSPGSEAARSVEMIVALALSSYTGSRLTVPLDRPLRDVTIRSW